MKKQANRKAIVISAALTVLLLTFVGGGVLMVSRIFAQPVDSQLSTPAAGQSNIARDVAVVAPASASPLHRPVQPTQRPSQPMPRPSPLTKPSPSAQVAVAQAPVQLSQAPSSQATSVQHFDMPSKPARPVFVGPITRTRAS